MSSIDSKCHPNISLYNLFPIFAVKAPPPDIQELHPQGIPLYVLMSHVSFEYDISWYAWRQSLLGKYFDLVTPHRPESTMVKTIVQHRSIVNCNIHKAKLPLKVYLKYFNIVTFRRMHLKL